MLFLYFIHILFLYYKNILVFQERTAASKKLHLWMCCQLYPSLATPPSILPCPFLHLPSTNPRPPPIFQPCPFSPEPPWSGMLLPSPGSDSREFRIFPFPLLYLPAVCDMNIFTPLISGSVPTRFPHISLDLQPHSQKAPELQA